MHVKNRNITRLWVKRLFLLGLCTALVGLVVFTAFVFSVRVPSVDALTQRKVPQSTKIFDRTGETVLFEIFQEEKRTVIPFEDIPRNVKNATIAIEDTGFYAHGGISPLSILRAFMSDLLRGRILVQGGSTITQQLVKNALLTSEKTITRKVKEAILAVKIERVYSKDEILNLYLNEIPYGSNTYGVEAAAQAFFGKHAQDLTLAESAYLAALPKAPSYYSPYGNNVKELETRKNIVLNRMADLGFITRTEADAAKQEQVVFLSLAEHGIRAPHFVMYVIDQLNERYGEDFIQQNGLNVITSLDISLQQKAEETIEAHAEEIDKNFHATNAGLTAINPKTGEIMAMVGSRDFFDRAHEGNFNITTARRQPGSAFKPIVYAAAFERGYTPETVVFDVSTEFAVDGAESYRPQNYDTIFRGPVTLREALAQSINVPAVKVLYLTGLANALQMARTLGITTLGGPNQYGLTLVLGGGEVRLLELVSAYGVFANDGVRNEPVSMLRVETNAGKVLFEHNPNARQVIDSNVARLISSVLSDNNARAPAFGGSSALNFPNRQVAVKTGTTNDYRDAWIIGYTPQLAAGVWAGNNDNTPMEKRVAGFIVAPLWHDFMEKAFGGMPTESFQEPRASDATKPILNGIWKGGRTIRVDKISGKLATELTPPEFIEEQVIQDIHTILYWVDKNDPRGPIPSHPERDSQFAGWETGVRAWAADHGLLTSTPGTLPTEYDDAHTPEKRPHVHITSPQQNTQHTRSQGLIVTLSTEHSFPLQQMDYFVNGVLAGSRRSEFTEFSLDPSQWEQSSTAEIVVKIYDTAGNTGEAQVTVILSSA